MFLSLTAVAQESVSTHFLGIGNSRILDTYITQEKFSGTGITYLNIRECENPVKRWNNIIEHEMNVSSTKDRSQNAQAIEGDYNLYWGRYRGWHLLDSRLQLQAGALINANLGFIYDMTTSNNPAQARISLNAMPTGVATYYFSLFKQQLSMRYELDLPLAGVMFSPNYGQSYYEIFNRGNYDHNIVPTTFASAPNFRQLLTLNWQTNSKFRIHIGYLGNYKQAEVNNLKQHVYSHRLILGITRNLK